VPTQEANVDLACSPGVQYLASPLSDANLWAFYQSDVDFDVESISAFWQSSFSILSGSAFPGVCSVVEYAPATVPYQDACNVTPDIAEQNAFYCPSINVVMWDGPTFYQPLYSDLGDAALTFITAHEFGHAAQFLSDTMPLNSVNRELQADCYAGAYLRFAGERNYLDEGDIQEVIEIVRMVGQSRIGSTWRTRTHGTPLQRQLAVRRGFEEGIGGCQIDFSQDRNLPTRP
ncbi:MAG: hypothetical protein GYB68_09450, partial [Chloroflexi bacterium]|nr:hypothetical protein [Chloroflexota bacterium]